MCISKMNVYKRNKCDGRDEYEKKRWRNKLFIYYIFS